MQIPFQTVVIIGPGLIGGSLGLAMAQRKLARHIIGVSRTKRTLSLARRRGCISSGVTDWRRAVGKADLVILASPVQAILGQLQRMGPFLPPGCVVMDVGSTKQAIVKAAQAALPAEVAFVGAHPLAGSEKSGPGHARAELFRHCVCCLTPTRRTDPAALKRITVLWQQLGACVVQMSAAEHDHIIASTSHLPHLVAVVLMLSISPSASGFAAGGFRDMTRIAAGEETLWRDIFLTNRTAVLASARRFQKVWDRFLKALGDASPSSCTRLLAQARRRRQSLQRKIP